MRSTYLVLVVEMWDLPKGEDFLPRVNLDELEKLYFAENKAKPKIRLLCAIHRKRGESIDEIADITNLKRRTVHAILHRFKERGIGGKDNIKQGGRPSYLTIKAAKRTGKTIAKRIFEEQDRFMVNKRSSRLHQKRI